MVRIIFYLASLQGAKRFIFAISIYDVLSYHTTKPRTYKMKLFCLAQEILFMSCLTDLMQSF